MNAIKVDNRIIQEADDMSKETHIPFRQCLDILVRAYLSDVEAEVPASQALVAVA